MGDDNIDNDIEKPEDTQSTRSVTRRNLIIGVGGIVALCALGGVTRAFASDGAELLRPPGGQDESSFLSVCIKCDRCRSACPQGAIGVAHIEDGFLSARTPKMKYKLGYCNFCRDIDGGPRCIASCPTDALKSGFDPLSDRIGVAVFDTDECVLYRTGGLSCSKQCFYACEYNAIEDDGNGRLRVIEDACNGCGQCEYECPSASYASYTGSDRRGINVEPLEGRV